jgi:superfamily II DNA or RNA helicase
MIEKLQVPTLVIVPSLELKRQLKESLTRAFGSLKNIRVENIDSLDPNKVEDKVDCVIIDEFHHSAASSYRTLNKKALSKVYYKFGLTATAFRSQEHERLLLESVLSKKIFEITYEQAVKNKFIVPLEAYYIDLPLHRIKGNPKSWPSMYNELVVNNELRNGIIRKLLVQLKNNNKSTLCLVKEIKHGENIQSETGIQFVHGEFEDTPEHIDNFNKGLVMGLIGTTGVIGEGVNTKPCEYVIIAGLGKSRNALMQQFGRAFRTHPGKESAKVIIFNDPSHIWTKKHFREQVKILKEEYGVKPIKIEL